MEKSFLLRADRRCCFFFSHVNEHLADDTNSFILGEVFRSLAEGGVARFVAPDFDLAKDAYKRNDRDFFLHRVKPTSLESLEELDTIELFLKQFAARALVSSKDDGNRKVSAQELKQLIRDKSYEGAATEICSGMSIEAQLEAPGNHINWWNFKKFKKFLEAAGFKKIRRSGYLQSTCAPMRDPVYFDYRHPIISTYVEAIK